MKRVALDSLTGEPPSYRWIGRFIGINYDPDDDGWLFRTVQEAREWLAQAYDSNGTQLVLSIDRMGYRVENYMPGVEVGDTLRLYRLASSVLPAPPVSEVDSEPEYVLKVGATGKVRFPHRLQPGPRHPLSLSSSESDYLHFLQDEPGWHLVGAERVNDARALGMRQLIEYRSDEDGLFVAASGTPFPDLPVSAESQAGS